MRGPVPGAHGASLCSGGHCALRGRGRPVHDAACSGGGGGHGLAPLVIQSRGRRAEVQWTCTPSLVFACPLLRKAPTTRHRRAFLCVLRIAPLLCAGRYRSCTAFVSHSAGGGGGGRACAREAATTKGMAWPASPVATGGQGNPCSTATTRRNVTQGGGGGCTNTPWAMPQEWRCVQQ